MVCSKLYIIVSWCIPERSNSVLEIYELDPAKIFSAPGLAWREHLRKTKVKLDLLSAVDLLLIVQKGIRGGICHSIYQHGKANNKYMKYYYKNKKLSYLQYWEVNNFYGWKSRKACS